MDCQRELHGPRQLRDERIETGFRHLVDHRCAWKGGVRDKPYFSSPPCTNPSRQFEAIEDRHVQVDEHDLGRAKLYFVQRLRSVVGDPNRVAKQGHHFCARIRHVGHVVDDQDVRHDFAKLLGKASYCTTAQRGRKPSPAFSFVGRFPPRRRALADGVGFEPTKGLHPCRISSPVHSTALPPIHASTSGTSSALGKCPSAPIVPWTCHAGQELRVTRPGGWAISPFSLRQ